MAIQRQELNCIDDDKGTIHLHTVVSTDEAIEHTRRDSECGGRIGKGSDSIMIGAEIPAELFTYDPLLRHAMQARQMGDIPEYTHYIRMFMKLNPQFVPIHDRRIFTTR